MRILLDECLPRRLARLLAEHDVQTVPEAGWAGVDNGELLQRAQGKYDAFITVDRGIPFQQNIGSHALAVVVLKVQSNRLDDIRPLVPLILEALSTAKAGMVMNVG